MKDETYYNIQADQLNLVLLELNNLGYKWKENAGTSPISKYYSSSLAYGLETPVLKVNKKYKDIILTDKIVLKENKNTEKIFTYDTFIQDLDLKLVYLKPKHDWFFQLFGEKVAEKNYKKFLNKKLSEVNKSLESLSWYLGVENIDDPALVNKYHQLKDNVKFIDVLIRK